MSVWVLSATTLPVLEPLGGARGSDVEYPLILAGTEVSPGRALALALIIVKERLIFSHCDQNHRLGLLSAVTRFT